MMRGWCCRAVSIAVDSVLRKSNPVRTAELPSGSDLHRLIQKGDFLDCYAVESPLSARDAAEIALQFPPWVSLLMKLRNAAVTPFGLATDEPTQAKSLGPFPVESETDTELVVGFNDKHLDFRVSVYAEAGKVFLATWVHPHNIGGRVYLSTIMVFHIIIVRDALRRVAAR